MMMLMMKLLELPLQDREDSKASRNPSGRRAVPLFALACMLASPVLAVAQQNFTHRLTGVSYDFDNNGIPDATTSISYDGSGRATGVVYTYTDDGTPDLFNTEDDDAASETTALGYNADDLIETSDFDRTLMPSGLETTDTTFTFTSGVLTRFDSTGDVNGVTSSFYGELGYTSNQLTSLTVRDASDDSILILQSYTNGGDGLPSSVTALAGVTTTTMMSWRTDGQLDDLASTTTLGATQIGSGTADYLYDANGRIQAEAWTSAPGVGAPFAEFAGRTYRKTYSYDGQQLKTLEQIDINDNGSVEATRTFTWTPGSCVPAFNVTPNGRPNFAEMPGFPYTPGTGATWLENCGPYLAGGSNPSPVPGLSWISLGTLVASMALIVGFHSRRTTTTVRG